MTAQWQESAAENVYCATGIDQSYGGIRALDGVDFAVAPGEVHALLGANGAGKSSLAKILGGFAAPTDGVLAMKGRSLTVATSAAAESLGIVTVTQELSLFPELSVLENLFVPHEPRRRGVPDWSEMRRAGAAALQHVGLADALHRRVKTLSLADRQLVEIARALTSQPQVLILDEPTSALNAHDTQRVLNIVRGLSRNGVAVVYVSHFLEDVLAIADSVTVLREGRVVVERRPTKEMSIGSIVEAMLGQPPTTPTRLMPTTSSGSHGPRLELKQVAVPKALSPLDLDVSAGEIVGLAGLEGSGVHTLLQLLFGGRRSSGLIRLPSGKRLGRGSRRAVRAGVALVPADRRRLGLLINSTVEENISLCTSANQPWTKPRVDAPVVRARAVKQIESLGISTSGPGQRVSQLSGGNQQKVVFAKWLETHPSLVLLDDPTRGVDIGARSAMHGLIRHLASDECAVLVHSSDPEELVQLCDRVLVFYKGTVVTELRGADVSVPNLMAGVMYGQVHRSVAHSESKG